MQLAIPRRSSFHARWPGRGLRVTVGEPRQPGELAWHNGITLWGLSRLLGLPWLSDIYKWLNGTQRPSQMYTIRLCKLYQLHLQGLQLITVHHINWDGDGRIHLKERVNVSGTGGIPSKRRRLSPQESRDQDLRDKFMAHSPR